MKTKVNNIRFMMLLAFVAIAMTAWSQRPNEEKMSVSTQIFLDEFEFGVSYGAPRPQTTLPVVQTEPFKYAQLIANPDTIDGRLYMSAFVKVTDDSVISQLEALGVEIQCQFENGLMTTLIPIERIKEVVAIEGVKKVNAATLMRPLTDNAREATNVDDVLTLSNDALDAGLTQQYDGSGVIIGVIDTGIDFNHIAFKDKNGNSRIKRAYVYNGSSEHEYTSITSSNLTDDNAEDHGTHTSSIAGGSSVIVNGNNVTVTDDHANATYGGMAPGADLYLAGVRNLNNIYLANAINNICDYADQEGKPLVVSNSWGSQWGPHDGTGEDADIYNSLFGPNHPNRIALFAASNDGAKSKDGEGGGYHISGTATSANPIRTILRSDTYINTDGGYFYQGLIANAWARNTNVTQMAVKIYVLDANTGAVKTSVTVTSSGSVTGLGTYYDGTLSVYFDYVESNKTQLILYSQYGITSRSTSTTTQNGSTYYKSDYTLAIEIYPYRGANSSFIDVWGGNNGYFTNHLTTNGYNWQAGNDDMCVSDQAMIPNVISIGAYVTKNQITNYNGQTANYPRFVMGDIADFSSYAVAEDSPTGLQYPWITAPGARLVAGVNHNHTASVDEYSYYGNTFIYDLVVNNSSNPYAAMQGTSMACPAAAGIVALWLQASLDDNAEHKNLTVNDVKEIMMETAIHDQWTDGGPNASHFGNGKINALAGIEYILGGSTPKIIANPVEVNFGEVTPGGNHTATVTVRGRKLTGDITAALTDGSGVFSIDPSNLGQGGELVITFSPNAEGDFTATITLTSPGAEPVTITITGHAVIRYSILTSSSAVIPVYHSEAQVHDATYVFTRSQVDDDTDMSLSYNGNAAVKVNVLAKNDESIVSYDLHHKVGNSNWTYPNGEAVASAIQQNDPNTYVVNQETFTIPQDATEMWLQLIDKSVDAHSTVYYVPVTVADGVLTQGNTYGAPQVQASNDPIYFNVSVGGSKSAGRPGGHWDQNGVDYCVYTPVVTITNINPTFDGENRTPYLIRAWLLKNDNVRFYSIVRVANENDPDNSHIEAGDELTYPYPLGELHLESDMIGEQYSIGHDWSGGGNDPWNNPWGDVEGFMENVFAAPSTMPTTEHMRIAVRIYYYKPGENVSGSQMLAANRDGDAPGDGYGYGEGEGNGEGIPTAVAGIYTDRQVVDVKYVNPQGLQSNRPFDGMNIVVTRYNDGSVTTSKVVR